MSAVVESPWIRVPLVLGAALALQTGLLVDVRPFGVVPDLLLLLALAGGLAAGPERGAVAGFVIGLTYDLVLQTPFGLSALVYASGAYAIGHLRLSVLKSGEWWITMLAVLGMSAACVVAFAVVGSLFGMEHVVNLHLVQVALVVSVINAVLAPVALRVMRWSLAADQQE